MRLSHLNLPTRGVNLLAVGIPAVVMLAASTMSALRRPLWRDEMATWLFASLDPGRLWSATTHVDAVMAPYYCLAHAAFTIIPLDFGLRLISILAGAATIVVVGLLALRWWGAVPAFITGVVIATNPLAFEMFGTARPYALATLFVALAAASLDRALRPGRRLAAWAGYGASVAAIGLMHLLALLAVTATASLVIGAKRGKVIAWALTTTAAALVVAPFAIVASFQARQVSWIAKPSPRSAMGSLASVVVFKSDGRLDWPNAIALLVVGMALLASLVLILRTGPSATRFSELRRFGFAALTFLFPWAFLLAESLIAQPYLRTTYLTPTVVGLALVLGNASYHLTNFLRRAARAARLAVPHALIALAPALLLAIPVVIALPASVSALRAPWWMDDFPGLAAALDSSASPGDTIVFVQHYSETGVNAGIARTTDDSTFARSVRAKLVAGTQSELEVRRVAAVHPLLTVSASSPSVGHPVRVIYTRGGFGPAEVQELTASGITCSDPSALETALVFGLLRYDSSLCRANP